jgi:hypothetical protein
MGLKQLRHSVLAIWLGLFTMLVVSVQQWQLSSDVIAAAAADAHSQDVAVHHPPDCPMGKSGGHSHRGHADCKVCGVLAALTAVTLPVVLAPVPPSELVTAAPVATPVVSRAGLSGSPYKSRGPPASA